jgi:4-hydroxy-tetrahydrodipicolinate reductase
MKIGIVGCAGRMGRMLIASTLDTKGAELAGGTEVQGSPHLGTDLGTLAGGQPIGLGVEVDAPALFAKSDVVIDFTRPAATLAHAQLAAEAGKNMVVGTTGLAEADMKKLREAGTKIAIVQAGNMSLGVNLLLGLIKQAAKALGPEYDIEVVEMHHRHKVDAPSGTALMLGRAAAEGRAIDHRESAVMTREGHTGERPKGAIGYATLRGGDVIGDHSLIFAGPGERVELSHRATSRDLFARGAIKAAFWTQGEAPGLYSMRDVLGL